MAFVQLPTEIICKIYEFLPEKSRRQLKIVSKRLRNCYITYIYMRKSKPPKNIRKCSENCNYYNNTVLHECVCTRRRLIGWERY